MKKLKELSSFLISIIVGLFLAVFISIYVFQPTMVVGSSMEPTLLDKHRIYISKLPRIFAYEPKYGDIVILDSELDQKRTFTDDLVASPLLRFLFVDQDDRRIWVKRIIGKAGDVIEIKNNQVYRNKKKLNETYIKETMDSDDIYAEVPIGHIFVMGDNRNYSRDSREIGTIPIDKVLGTKLFQE